MTTLVQRRILRHIAKPYEAVLEPEACAAVQAVLNNEALLAQALRHARARIVEPEHVRSGPHGTSAVILTLAEIDAALSTQESDHADFAIPSNSSS